LGISSVSFHHLVSSAVMRVQKLLRSRSKGLEE
jgi:hypothetical protein